MRRVRLLVLAAALGAPLGAQDVTPAPADPLTATLHFASYSDMWFESNQPAYFAVFELTHDRLVQLHPYWSADRKQAATTGYARGSLLAGHPSIYLAQRSLVSSRRYGYGYGYDYGAYPSRFAIGELHTLLLVASRQPLHIGSPMDAMQLQYELSRRGHAFDLDRDSGVDALVNLITDGASDDDVAVDLLPVDPQQLWYTSSAYGLPSSTSLYCANRFSGIYDWFPWQFSDYYCNPYYLNPWIPPVPTPLPTPGPQRVTEQMVAVPLKMLNGGNSTSDPEEIRRVIDRLREYDAQRATGFIDRAPVPGMGGAETNNRLPATEVHRTFTMPSAPTGQGSIGGNSGTSRGTYEPHRTSPYTRSTPRTFTSPSSPSNGGYSTSARPDRSSMPDRARPQGARPTEGLQQISSPRFNAPSAASAPAPAPAPARIETARPAQVDPKKP